MKITDNISKDIIQFLNNKKVLEVACGDSEFSLSASKYAKNVLATDISLERFKKKALNQIPQNVEFREMDGSNLQIDKNTFDTSVCYNTLGHLEDVLALVIEEMKKVTKPGGHLIFIATWKMDKKILSDFKNTIGMYGELKLELDIEKNRYKILVINNKKIG